MALYAYLKAETVVILKLVMRREQEPRWKRQDCRFCLTLPEVQACYGQYRLSQRLFVFGSFCSSRASFVDTSDETTQTKDTDNPCTLLESACYAYHRRYYIR